MRTNKKNTKTFCFLLKDRIRLLVYGIFIAFPLMYSISLFGDFFLYKLPCQQYEAAMRAGNGKKAIYLATKLFLRVEKSHNSYKEMYGWACKTRLNRHYQYLCYAYELNGEFDVALERYQAIESQIKTSPLDIARIFYNTGRHAEAFEKYCTYYQKFVKHGPPYPHYDENRISDEILFNSYSYCQKLQAFPTFYEFYTFMEKEYESRGKPDEYAEVLELFAKVLQNLSSDQKIPLWEPKRRTEETF